MDRERGEKNRNRVSGWRRGEGTEMELGSDRGEGVRNRAFNLLYNKIIRR